MGRGRPRKNPIVEENTIKVVSKAKPAMSDETKKRGRPKKSIKSEPTHTNKIRQGELIFSLDIGTRTVVGIVGQKNEDVFEILDSAVVAHTKRAMIDGQIEDIDEVAKVVKKVKEQLESRLKLKLTKVAIAAAGRALKTQHVKVNIDVDGKDSITEEMVKSFELEAISQAQIQLDDAQKDDTTSFYCVGHSVVNYFLDDYPIKSFVGHKGKTATVDMIAAFLPSIVVESLYAVMDKNKLEVASLTLEPIAAMNVIIPPEVRLINIALVDIGAGTSDIAVSKNGSIVAYAMATIAGDEITEEIIKRYLVDFETAENMKMDSHSEKIGYKDILGYEHTITNEEFFKSLFPAVDLLADTIVKNILEVNGESPSAIFLVGGGSLVPDLTKMVAKKLNIPETRVAVGGHNVIKNVSLGKTKLTGPEFVTPIGIGVTATLEKGYDFSVVTLNKKKVRVFNTKEITILDLLTISGYKSANIIGRSGRTLTFTLNGEQQVFKGEIAIPAIITVNDIPANINTSIKQGDNIVVIPAVNGISADITISDLAGDVAPKKVFIEGMAYTFGTVASVNGEKVDESYKIQSFDDVKITSVSSLGDLLQTLPFPSEKLIFFKGKRRLSLDYFLCDGDEISVEEKPEPIAAAPIEKPFSAPAEKVISVQQPVAEVIPEPEVISKAESIPQPKPIEKGITITLNGHFVTLDKKDDGMPHLFLELTALANLDTTKPQGTGDIILTLNGKVANYMDPIFEGDTAVIAWAK